MFGFFLLGVIFIGTQVLGAFEVEVAGGNGNERVALHLIAQDTRVQFHTILGISNDVLGAPIAIEIVQGSVGLPRTELLILPDHAIFHVIVSPVHLSFPSSIAEELLITYLKEFLMRVQLPISRGPLVFIECPYWIEQGIIALIQWNAYRTGKSLYPLLLKAPIPLEELFKPELHHRESGLVQDLYRISSGILVSVLLSQPKGTVKFIAMLRAVPSFRGTPSQLVHRHFSSQKGEKLNLTLLCKQRLQSILGEISPALQETETIEKRLEAILYLRGVGDVREGGGSFEDYKALCATLSLDCYHNITKRYNTFSFLRPQTTILYHGVIDAYQGFLMALLNTPETAGHFYKVAAAIHRKAREKSQVLESLLDTLEIQYSSPSSHVFPLELHYHIPDSINSFLDQVERRLAMPINDSVPSVLRRPKN